MWPENRSRSSNAQSLFALVKWSSSREEKKRREKHFSTEAANIVVKCYCILLPLKNRRSSLSQVLLLGDTQIAFLPFLLLLRKLKIHHFLWLYLPLHSRSTHTPQHQIGSYQLHRLPIQSVVVTQRRMGKLPDRGENKARGRQTIFEALLLVAVISLS